MTGSFKLTKSNQEVTIQGLEFDDYQYTTNFVKYYQAYLFEDTITYNILYKVDLVSIKDQTTEETIEYQEFVQHDYPEEHSTSHCHDTSTFKFEKDGLYKVMHIIVPTRDWLVKYLSAFGKDFLLDVYQTVYFSDGNTFFKLNSTSYEEVDVEEITTVNIEGTTICRSEQFTFCTDRLEYCYYKLASALLDDICPLDECDEDGKSNAWYTLQLIQIERYVIQFLLEKHRYLEAEEILKALSGCAGPCYSILNNTSNLLNINLNKTNSNCGCSM